MSDLIKIAAMATGWLSAANSSNTSRLVNEISELRKEVAMLRSGVPTQESEDAYWALRIQEGNRAERRRLEAMFGIDPNERYGDL